MKVALAGRRAPAAVRSECSRPSATARPAPAVNNSMPPPAPPAQPLSPPPPPLPLRLWPRQAGAPRPTSQTPRSPPTLPNAAACFKKNGGRDPA
ncbi:hypothetical protein NN561_011307 [Cricetulus griseus]